MIIVIVKLLIKAPWKSIGTALFQNRSTALILLLSIPLIVISVFLLDMPVRLLFSRFHTAFADTLFYYFNLVGDGMVLYPILLGYLFFSLLFLKPKQIHFAWMLILSVLLAGLLCQVVKIFFLRARPYVTEDPLSFFVFVKEGFHFALFNLGNTSFPSGHTTTAFALWTPILLKVKSTWLKGILYILPLMTGFSRIYFNKHWFTDVGAGALLGLWVAYAISQSTKSSDEIGYSG